MTDSKKTPRFACLAALALSLAACKSSGAPAVERVSLPYHVALAPTVAETFENQNAASEGRNLEVDLQWYASAAAGDEQINLPKVLAKELEKEIFSKVTVLPAVNGVLDQAELVSGARAAGADLLMTIEQVTFDSAAETEARPSNWFWWLTGPFVYMFNDRSFRVDSTIEVALYNVNRLADPAELAEGEDPGDYELDPAALVRRFRAKPDWIETKYTDRAGGGVDYVKSIFVPTSFLKPTGEQVSRKVAAESIESMARSLADDISIDADFVIHPNQRQTPFQLEESVAGQPAEPKLVGEGPDTHLVFETEILQRRASARREFHKAEIRVGDQVWELGQSGQPGPGGSITLLGDQAAPDNWVRKRIEATIPIEAAASLLTTKGTFQISLNDSRDPRSRQSWTFPVGAENVRAIEAASREQGMPNEAIFRKATSKAPR